MIRSASQSNDHSSSDVRARSRRGSDRLDCVPVGKEVGQFIKVLGVANEPAPAIFGLASFGFGLIENRGDHLIEPVVLVAFASVAHRLYPDGLSRAAGGGLAATSEQARHRRLAPAELEPTSATENPPR